MAVVKAVVLIDMHLQFEFVLLFCYVYSWIPKGDRYIRARNLQPISRDTNLRHFFNTLNF